MASALTRASYVSRLAIKGGILLLVGLMVGRVLLSMGVRLWKAVNPPAPPPPTFGFGILPDIQFPDQKEYQLQYKLETATGTLPSFGPTAKVFLEKQEQPSLLALEEASQLAVELGFEGTPIQLSEQFYRWEAERELPTTLTMHIYRKTFRVSGNWRQNPSFILENEVPGAEQAVSQATTFLERADLFPEDIAEAQAEVSFLRIKNNVLTPAVSQSEADFIKVDYFREPIDESFPVVTFHPQEGVIQAMLTGAERRGVMVDLEYNYFAVDYEQFETYPLKTTERAWQELVQNQGYVANLEDGVESVVVREMELGYFDSLVSQEYLQPIYIFRGDNDFVGYVPAVRPPEETTE